MLKLSMGQSSGQQVESCVLEEQVEEDGGWHEEAYQYQPDLPHCSSSQESENEAAFW